MEYTKGEWKIKQYPPLSRWCIAVELDDKSYHDISIAQISSQEGNPQVSKDKERSNKMTEEEARKPICELTESDGNVFAIIGKVSKTLKRAGQPEKAEEFAMRARNSDSYDAVLRLCFDYVEVG